MNKIIALVGALGSLRHCGTLYKGLSPPCKDWANQPPARITSDHPVKTTPMILLLSAQLVKQTDGL